MSGQLQPVHVRVSDSATGKPTPCRIRFTDAQGNYYAPYGRLTRFAAGLNQAVGGNVYLGVKPHAYIDGTCEIDLPPGPLHVEIRKGPEYEAVRADVTLAPGKLALRFTLRRWTDLRQEGWYSGDTRAQFLPPHAALLEGQAEDLAVVNLLAAETTVADAFGEAVRAVPNLLAFSGQAFALSVPGHGVAVNTLNRHAVLGTLALLHCHRIVFPLTFGGPDGTDNWTLADWCDQCHRKRGLVIWADVARQTGQGYGEALADLILGKVDALELDHFDDSPFDALADWMALLNAGLTATLVGASGKTSNGRAVGVMRTYARLAAGEPFGYTAWIEAVRAGRTFVTNGPLIRLCVNGIEPSVVPVDVPGGQPVRIQATVRSALPFDRLAVCWCGEWIDATPAAGAGPPFEATVEMTRELPHDGWLAVGCFGATSIPDRPAAQRVFACTSPVYVRRHGGASWPSSDAVRKLLGELDAGEAWVRAKARCASERDRERLAAVFEQARRVLAERGKNRANGSVAP